MRIALPSRDNGALLPAVLSGVLLLALAGQLALPNAPELPDVWSAPPRRMPQREAAAVTVDPIIADRALFTPTRRFDGDAGGGDEAQAAVPLRGAVVAGVVAVRRVVWAIVRTPSRGIVRVRVGGEYEGWRLAGVTREAAIFEQDGKRLTMPLGAAPAPVRQSGESEEEQVDEEQ